MTKKEKVTKKPGKGKKTGLSTIVNRLGRSGLTQLMVFLNGLILTITAFATLTVFINQMRNEDTSVLIDQVKISVQDNMERMSGALEMIGQLQSTVIKEKNNMAALAKLIPDRTLFDRVLWLEHIKGEQWRAYDLYNAQNAKTDPSAYIQNIIPRLKRDTNIQVLTNTEETLQPSIKDPHIRAQPLMMLRPVLNEGDVKHVIVGMTRLSNGIVNTGMGTNKSIVRFVMRDESTGARLMQVDRRTGVEGVDAPVMSLQTTSDSWDQKLGDLSLGISIDIQENVRMAFISHVPFLLLLFGLTLTMIGTLYVRSNHRQSIRLSAMNTALSSKNLELKNQIEESNRLYETIQRSEREYRGVIDSVSDIIFETDSAGNILFVNATWEKVTGFSIEHSLGRDLFDMLHPAEHDTQRLGFMGVVRDSQEGYRSITRLHTANGKYRAIELAFSSVRTDNARTTRVVGTITDVEERRRAEKALAEAEKKFRTIVENAAGGIYQVNPDGRILSANPSLAHILGYRDARELMEVVEDLGTQYTDPRDRLRYERDLERFGFVRNHETTIRRKDGQIIWISENARAVKDDDGNILYYEGSIEDTTQRKKAESGLKDAKLQSDLANRAKSEFLANMSHELRTPLNAIIGFSEIIHNEALGPVGQPPYAEYAGDIHDSGKKLLTIINDILDISRIEAGERTLNETLFSLKDVASTCVSLLSSKAEAGRLNVLNNLHEDLPKIIGEELAFKQILMNLLSNAIKFTPPDGRITLDCDYVGDEKSDLRLSLTDTGIGMDDKEIEKALSPFGQVEEAFSRSNSGTGLGLTLVDALIKMHAGTFELVSRKGVGTTATIIIPTRRIAKPAEKNDLADATNVTPFMRTNRD